MNHSKFFKENFMFKVSKVEEGEFRRWADVFNNGKRFADRIF